MGVDLILAAKGSILYLNFVMYIISIIIMLLFLMFRYSNIPATFNLEIYGTGR